MLQRIRDSLQGQKWLAYVVIGVLALVFAAWGAYGIVELNFGGSNFAAKVEGEKVSIDEAREAWMQQQAAWSERLGGGELPAELKSKLQDDLLESFVRNTLLTQRANELGYRVTKAQVDRAITSEPAFQIDGKYNADAAKSTLARVGISPEAYAADLKQSLQRAQMQNAIRVSQFLTPYELMRLRALEDEEREVQFAMLPAEKFAGDAKIDDATVEKAYKETQSRYMNPEYVRLAYAELRLEQLAAQAAVTDEEVRDYYEKSKDRFVTPEKRRVRQILIAGDKDDAAARKKAESVLAEAKSGKDFAALAKQYSDDTGSAQQGGDIGFIERSYFVAPFAEAAFSMTAGEVRGPVKTEYGYHIIKLEEVQPGTTRSFEDARAEIRGELQRDRAADRLSEVQQQLEQRIEAPGADLDAIARDFDMQVGQVDRFERDAGGAPLGNSEDLQEAIFSADVIDERRVAGPIPLGEDRLIIVKALEHHPAAPKPLAEVREAVIAELRKQRGTEAATKAADAARARLEAGTPFDAVARELGVTAEPAKFIGRNDPSVPAQIRDLAFRSPKPTSKPVYRTAELNSGGAALVAITKVRAEPGSTNTELQTARVEDALNRKGVGDFAAYVEEVRRNAEVVKNPSAFE